MSECECREQKCPVCWPKCEECESALGEDEMRFCGVCCATFDDCWEQEEEARVSGVRPTAPKPAHEEPRVPEQVHASAKSAVDPPMPAVDPPMKVGTVQQTFAFDFDA